MNKITNSIATISNVYNVYVIDSVSPPFSPSSFHFDITKTAPENSIHTQAQIINLKSIE